MFKQTKNPQLHEYQTEKKRRLENLNKLTTSIKHCQLPQVGSRLLAGMPLYARDGLIAKSDEKRR